MTTAAYIFLGVIVLLGLIAIAAVLNGRHLR